MAKFRVEKQGRYSRGVIVEATTEAEARRIAAGIKGGDDYDDVIYSQTDPRRWPVERVDD